MFKLKVLIMRFSSLGDIVQALEVPRSIKKKYPQAEIHWITKTEFAEIVSTNSYIDKVWKFNRDRGLKGLHYYYKVLKNEDYSLIYDAHNNLRTTLLKIPLWLFTRARFITRPKNRIRRFLFFKLGFKKLLPIPFRGMESFLWPLKSIGIPQVSYEAHPLELPVPQVLGALDHIDQAICIAPSAAWKLKRWSVENWQKLIKSFPDKEFYIIGGPTDTFCKDIQSIAPDRCFNYAGKLTWVETFWLINQSKILVSGDTGALHVADFLGKDCVGLIGPSAFGFPSRPKSKALSANLSCQPCSKDGSSSCKNKQYQRCLTELTPEIVKLKLDEIERGFE